MDIAPAMSGSERSVLINPKWWKLFMLLFVKKNNCDPTMFSRVDTYCSTIRWNTFTFGRCHNNQDVVTSAKYEWVVYETQKYRKIINAGYFVRSLLPQCGPERFFVLFILSEVPLSNNIFNLTLLKNSRQNLENYGGWLWFLINIQQ